MSAPLEVRAPEAYAELQAVREELQEQFFSETSRADRDAWSHGMSHGLRAALEIVERRMGEVDS